MKRMLMLLLEKVLMKRIGFILLILLTNTCLYAQDSQEYYVGTWRWVDNNTNSEIVVKLRLFTGNWETGGTYTTLVGAYSYKINGEIIADFLNEVNTDYGSWVKYPISFKYMRELRIRDYALCNGYGPKYIKGSSTIKHISSNPDKIKWILVDDARAGDIIVDPKLVEPAGISLPVEIILTRVE